MTSSSPPRPGTNIDSTYSRESHRTLRNTPDRPQNLRHRPPRSLPPWIDSYDNKLGSATDDQLRLLDPPAPAVQPQHNSTPGAPQRRVSKDGFVDPEDPLQGQGQGARGRIPHILRYGRASMRGRKWDHLRSAEPVVVPGFIPPYMSTETPVTWHDFVTSSNWGHMANEESKVVDLEVLNKLQPGFNGPTYQPYNEIEAQKPSRRRRTLAPYKRVWNMVIRHAFAPLLFRLTVMLTSIMALGVAARVYQIEHIETGETAEETQSVMAVCVDCVAIPYIAYMIWDEYTGQPLGLRSVKSKISLILLDLFFIIFKSASTALAFESLVFHNLTDTEVRSLSKALAAFMLTGLIAWTMNFAVNIFRTVERLGGHEDE